MDIVNRVAVVLVPKKPYLDWANSFADGGPTILPAEAREHAVAFLVPDLELLEETQHFITENSARMFEYALLGWMEDERDWPKFRNHLTLREWFDVEVHDLLIDLGNDPIEVRRADA